MNKVSYKKSYNETIKKVVAKELTKKEFAFKQEITDIQVQKNFIFFFSFNFYKDYSFLLINKKKIA